MLKEISKIGNYPVYLLNKNVAEKYKEQITIIWNLIPLSNHAVNDILKEESESGKYNGKWIHSLIVLDLEKKHVIAFIVGYEREGGKEEAYPKDSMHLKSISVHNAYQNQGIGRKLVKLWLDYNKKSGFNFLKGDLIFSVQTNSADWNNHVQRFYESFGFKKTATKKYENKLDNVYFLNK